MTNHADRSYEVTITVYEGETLSLLSDARDACFYASRGEVPPPEVQEQAATGRQRDRYDRFTGRLLSRFRGRPKIFRGDSRKTVRVKGDALRPAGVTSPSTSKAPGFGTSPTPERRAR